MAKDEIETTIWILGKDNKHLPALQYTPESNLSIFMYYLLYVVIWIYITTTYADTRHKTEIISGFIFGLIILLILDYINNFSKQLVIDKNTGAFTLINSEAVYIAENNYYQFNDTNAVLMKINLIHY